MGRYSSLQAALFVGTYNTLCGRVFSLNVNGSYYFVFFLKFVHAVLVVNIFVFLRRASLLLFEGVGRRLAGELKQTGEMTSVTL